MYSINLQCKVCAFNFTSYNKSHAMAACTVNYHVDQPPVNGLAGAGTSWQSSSAILGLPEYYVNVGFWFIMPPAQPSTYKLKRKPLFYG